MARVLVVDDAAFARLKVRKLLEQGGHEVLEAATGYEAVEAYQHGKPDAVLLDIVMPEMDGLAALQAIRKVDPNARVAMVSAVGQQSKLVEAIRAGAKDFVVKPYQPDRLLATVKKLLVTA